MKKESNPTVLELAIRVHRGELTPDQALQVLQHSERRSASETPA